MARRGGGTGAPAFEGSRGGPKTKTFIYFFRWNFQDECANSFIGVHKDVESFIRAHRVPIYRSQNKSK